MSSIRSKLLAWQMVALVLTAVLVSVLTSRLAWEGFNNVRDLGLEQIAETVLRHDEALGPAPAEAVVHEDPASAILEKRWFAGEEYLSQFVSQVWGPGGELLYSSLSEVGPSLQSAGHHIVLWKGQSWRVFTMPKNELTVQVAVTTHIRRQHFYELTLWLAVPMMILVLGLGGLIYLVVTRSLRPIERLGEEISQRDLTALERFPTDNMPKEIVPLGTALNQLLERLDALLANQRRLLADAAHELNTPLAAIRLQGQLARRAPDAERQAALDELDQGVARAGHVVARLLQFARLEPEAIRPDFVRVPLDDLATQVVIAFSSRASAAGIDLGLTQCESVEVWGDPYSLRGMLDNLVDNAVRYCPTGAHIDLAVKREGDSAVIDVQDSGPGIPAEDRARALDRFVRLGNGRSQQGSGLGLSIVDRIVKLHHGQLALRKSGAGGLWVRIELPLAPGAGAGDAGETTLEAVQDKG